VHSTSVQAPAYDDLKSNAFKSEKIALNIFPDYENEPEFVRRAENRSSRPRKNRGIVKFRPLDVEGLSSDSEPDIDDTKLGMPLDSPTTVHLRPWLVPRPSLSSRSTGSTTVLGDDSSAAHIKEVESSNVIEKERAKLLTMRKSMYNADNSEVPEYSDHEEDVTTEIQLSRDDPAWSPPFLRRHRESPGEFSTKGSNSSELRETPPPGVVPVTPPLINALDRIAVAQGQAYGSSVHEGLPERLAERKLEGQRWDLFWKDVNDKARRGQR